MPCARLSVAVVMWGEHLEATDSDFLDLALGEAQEHLSRAVIDSHFAADEGIWHQAPQNNERQAC